MTKEEHDNSGHKDNCQVEVPRLLSCSSLSQFVWAESGTLIFHPSYLIMVSTVYESEDQFQLSDCKNSFDDIVKGPLEIPLSKDIRLKSCKIKMLLLDGVISR